MKRVAHFGTDAHKFICRECGAACEAAQPGGVFCDKKCTNAWGNRRLKRGALVYDVLMEMRFNRRGAKGLWTLLCRLAEEWREEDRRIRTGLKSWKDPHDIIEKRVYLIGKRGRI